jgi:hypothetical protein
MQNLVFTRLKTDQLAVELRRLFQQKCVMPLKIETGAFSRDILMRERLSGKVCLVFAGYVRQ